MTARATTGAPPETPPPARARDAAMTKSPAARAGHLRLDLHAAPARAGQTYIEVQSHAARAGLVAS